MRTIAAILSFLLIVGLLFYGTKAYRDWQNVELNPIDADSAVPRPSKTGPHPKAVVVGGNEFDFGIMEQGQESEHVFYIRNDGKAPLELLANHGEDNTCECTVGKLSKNTILPGETVDVKVLWGVKKPVINFAHSATIRTNDPDKMKIPFIVKGLIGRRMVLKPGPRWSVGHLAGKEPVTLNVTLHSEIVDAFKLLKVESSSGLVTTTIRPLTAEELVQLGRIELSAQQKEKMDRMQPAMIGMANQPMPKSGYAITATIPVDKVPPGSFQETLTFITDIENGQPIDFFLTGSRAGPLEFMRSIGAEWSSRQLLLRLGTFTAKKGKTVRVPLLVKELAPDAEISVASIKPKFLEVVLERDKNFPAKKNRRYWLTLTVPPGKPPLALTAQHRGEVTLVAKGKETREMRFFVGFVSH